MIAIAVEDAILGRDADCEPGVIDDPSVSPRHARIVKKPDGTAWIIDLGSTAGTWINCEEAPREGCALREGDLLNLGRAAFRVRNLEEDSL
jgi:pSer/pThr/pTyr-binding forkhead associated (FHA) protein